eukprot:GHVH01004484.1.p1 GENE.GHVH01004484.1~~GHVH01004484.1.p1  ORF type:complete len:4034 (+),score=434.44 GHVH01004484.1:1169-12103(+)
MVNFLTSLMKQDAFKERMAMECFHSRFFGHESILNDADSYDTLERYQTLDSHHLVIVIERMLKGVALLPGPKAFYLPLFARHQISTCVAMAALAFRGQLFIHRRTHECSGTCVTFTSTYNGFLEGCTMMLTGTLMNYETLQATSPNNEVDGLIGASPWVSVFESSTMFDTGLPTESVAYQDIRGIPGLPTEFNPSAWTPKDKEFIHHPIRQRVKLKLKALFDSFLLTVLQHDPLICNSALGSMMVRKRINSIQSMLRDTSFKDDHTNAFKRSVPAIAKLNSRDLEMRNIHPSRCYLDPIANQCFSELAVDQALYHKMGYALLSRFNHAVVANKTARDLGFFDFDARGGDLCRRIVSKRNVNEQRRPGATTWSDPGAMDIGLSGGSHEVEAPQESSFQPSWIDSGSEYTSSEEVESDDSGEQYGEATSTLLSTPMISQSVQILTTPISALRKYNYLSYALGSLMQYYTIQPGLQHPNLSNAFESYLRVVELMRAHPEHRPYVDLAHHLVSFLPFRGIFMRTQAINLARFHIDTSGLGILYPSLVHSKLLSEDIQRVITCKGEVIMNHSNRVIKFKPIMASTFVEDPCLPDNTEATNGALFPFTSLTLTKRMAAQAVLVNEYINNIQQLDYLMTNDQIRCIVDDMTTSSDGRYALQRDIMTSCIIEGHYDHVEEFIQIWQRHLTEAMLNCGWNRQSTQTIMNQEDDIKHKLFDRKETSLIAREMVTRALYDCGYSKTMIPDIIGPELIHAMSSNATTITRDGPTDTDVQNSLLKEFESIRWIDYVRVPPTFMDQLQAMATLVHRIPVVAMEAIQNRLSTDVAPISMMNLQMPIPSLILLVTNLAQRHRSGAQLRWMFDMHQRQASSLPQSANMDNEHRDRIDLTCTRNNLCLGMASFKTIIRRICYFLTRQISEVLKGDYVQVVEKGRFIRGSASRASMLSILEHCVTKIRSLPDSVSVDGPQSMRCDIVWLMTSLLTVGDILMAVKVMETCKDDTRRAPVITRYYLRLICRPSFVRKLLIECTATYYFGYQLMNSYWIRNEVTSDNLEHAWNDYYENDLCYDLVGVQMAFLLTHVLSHLESFLHPNDDLFNYGYDFELQMTEASSTLFPATGDIPTPPIDFSEAMLRPKTRSIPRPPSESRVYPIAEMFHFIFSDSLVYCKFFQAFRNFIMEDSISSVLQCDNVAEMMTENYHKMKPTTTSWTTPMACMASDELRMPVGGTHSFFNTSYQSTKGRHLPHPLPFALANYGSEPLEFDENRQSTEASPHLVGWYFRLAHAFVVGSSVPLTRIGEKSDEDRSNTSFGAEHFMEFRTNLADQVKSGLLLSKTTIVSDVFRLSAFFNFITRAMSETDTSIIIENSCNGLFKPESNETSKLPSINNARYQRTWINSFHCLEENLRVKNIMITAHLRSQLECDYNITQKRVVLDPKIFRLPTGSNETDTIKLSVEGRNMVDWYSLRSHLLTPGTMIISKQEQQTSGDCPLECFARGATRTANAEQYGPMFLLFQDTIFGAANSHYYQDRGGHGPVTSLLCDGLRLSLAMQRPDSSVIIPDDLVADLFGDMSIPLGVGDSVNPIYRKSRICCFKSDFVDAFMDKLPTPLEQNEMQIIEDAPACGTARPYKWHQFPNRNSGDLNDSTRPQGSRQRHVYPNDRLEFIMGHFQNVSSCLFRMAWGCLYNSERSSSTEEEGTQYMLNESVTGKEDADNVLRILQPMRGDTQLPLSSILKASRPRLIDDVGLRILTGIFYHVETAQYYSKGRTAVADKSRSQQIKKRKRKVDASPSMGIHALFKHKQQKFFETLGNENLCEEDDDNDLMLKNSLKVDEGVNIHPELDWRLSSGLKGEHNKVTCSQCRQLGSPISPLVFIGNMSSGNQLQRYGDSDRGSKHFAPLNPKLFKCCGHVFHLDCVQACIDNAVNQIFKQSFYWINNAFNPLNGEFQCPVCRQLSNVIIPIIPLGSIVDVVPVDLPGKAFAELQRCAQFHVGVTKRKLEGAYQISNIGNVHIQSPMRTIHLREHFRLGFQYERSELLKPPTPSNLRPNATIDICTIAAHALEVSSTLSWNPRRIKHLDDGTTKILIVRQIDPFSHDQRGSNSSDTYSVKGMVYKRNKYKTNEINDVGIVTGAKQYYASRDNPFHVDESLTNSDPNYRILSAQLIPSHQEPTEYPEDSHRKSSDLQRYTGKELADSASFVESVSNLVTMLKDEDDGRLNSCRGADRVINQTPHHDSDHVYYNHMVLISLLSWKTFIGYCIPIGFTIGPSFERSLIASLFESHQQELASFKLKRKSFVAKLDSATGNIDVFHSNDEKDEANDEVCAWSLIHLSDAMRNPAIIINDASLVPNFKYSNCMIDSLVAPELEDILDRWHPIKGSKFLRFDPMKDDGSILPLGWSHIRADSTLFPLFVKDSYMGTHSDNLDRNLINCSVGPIILREDPGNAETIDQWTVAFAKIYMLAGGMDQIHNGRSNGEQSPLHSVVPLDKDVFLSNEIGPLAHIHPRVLMALLANKLGNMTILESFKRSTLCRPWWLTNVSEGDALPTTAPPLSYTSRQNLFKQRFSDSLVLEGSAIRPQIKSPHEEDIHRCHVKTRKDPFDYWTTQRSRHSSNLNVPGLHWTIYHHLLFTMIHQPLQVVPIMSEETVNVRAYQALLRVALVSAAAPSCGGSLLADRTFRFGALNPLYWDLAKRQRWSDILLTGSGPLHGKLRGSDMAAEKISSTCGTQSPFSLGGSGDSDGNIQSQTLRAPHNEFLPVASLRGDLFSGETSDLAAPTTIQPVDCLYHVSNSPVLSEKHWSKHFKEHDRPPAFSSCSKCVDKLTPREGMMDSFWFNDLKFELLNSFLAGTCLAPSTMLSRISDLAALRLLQITEFEVLKLIKQQGRVIQEQAVDASRQLFVAAINELDEFLNGDMNPVAVDASPRGNAVGRVFMVVRTMMMDNAELEKIESLLECFVKLVDDCGFLLQEGNEDHEDKWSRLSRHSASLSRMVHHPLALLLYIAICVESMQESKIVWPKCPSKATFCGYFECGEYCKNNQTLRQVVMEKSDSSLPIFESFLNSPEGSLFHSMNKTSSVDRCRFIDHLDLSHDFETANEVAHPKSCLLDSDERNAATSKQDCSCVENHMTSIPKCKRDECYSESVRNSMASIVYRHSDCPYQHCSDCTDLPTTEFNSSPSYHRSFNRLRRKASRVAQLTRSLMPLPATVGHEGGAQLIRMLSFLPNEPPSAVLEEFIMKLIEILRHSGFVEIEAVGAACDALTSRIVKAFIHSVGELLKFGFYLISSVVNVPSDVANRIAFTKFVPSSTALEDWDISNLKEIYQSWGFLQLDCFTSDADMSLTQMHQLLNEILDVDSIPLFVEQVHGEWVNPPDRPRGEEGRMHLAIRLGFCTSAITTTTVAWQRGFETRPLDTDFPHRFPLKIPDQYFDFLRDVTDRKGCPVCTSRDNEIRAICLLCGAIVCAGRNASSPNFIAPKVHQSPDNCTAGTDCCTPSVIVQRMRTFFNPLDSVDLEIRCRNDFIRTLRRDMFGVKFSANRFVQCLSTWGHNERTLTGEATEHTISCGGGSGLFMNTHNGAVFVVNHPRSAQLQAPYLDEDGRRGPKEFPVAVAESPRVISPALAEQLMETYEQGGLSHEIIKILIAHGIHQGYPTANNSW